MTFKMWLESQDVVTPAFRAWFGDSKVVDGSGKPMVVYHGTRAKRITAFNLNKVGSGNGRMANGIGYYFTDNPSAAEIYTTDPYTMERNPKKVIPVYLRIRKPFYSKGHILDQNVKRAEAEALTQKLVSGGYDGVIVDHGVHREYVVFDSAQIKHAVENVGTFSLKSNKIRV